MSPVGNWWSFAQAPWRSADAAHHYPRLVRFIGYLIGAGGLYVALAGLFDWDFFMDRPENQRVIAQFPSGRATARWLYVMAGGVAILAGGAMVVLAS